MEVRHCHSHRQPAVARVQYHRRVGARCHAVLWQHTWSAAAVLALHGGPKREVGERRVRPGRSTQWEGGWWI